MTTLTDPIPAPDRPGWLSRAEAWLDDKGRGAWITFMVLGFVFFWPIGLALVLYMTWTNRWSKSMFANRSHRSRSNWGDYHSGSPWAHCQARRSAMKASKPSGNSAFDQYKADTLSRLEREQDEFEAFLSRLRDAKDKAEFDQFMDERATVATAEDFDEAQDPGDDSPVKVDRPTRS